MRAANRGHYADSELMSTEAMGVAGASREGTHRPLTELQYRAARAAMRAANPGAACCMALQRELGLRAREAIQSISSLQVWANALKKRMSSEIVHGTKGGRKRHLAELHRDRALEVVETAILVAQAQGGKLIVTRSRRANTDGKKELKTAARAYCRACAKVGLKGEYSSHSIRCTYARERYERYMATHGDRREALASVSMDLGHGDGRGTYVAQVYLALPPRESPLL
jgi:hypothetical protein